MKKLFFILLMVFCFFMGSNNRPAQAGTVMLGAKGWYAEWDSALAKAIAEALVTGLNVPPDYITMDATIKPGKGYLIGPLLGYQTADNQWSFSVAFMLFSSFDQKTEMAGKGTYSGVNMDINTKLKRRDIDASVSYLLSSYFKLIAGFKYVTASYNLSYKILTQPETDFANIRSKSYIPTAGVAFAYPIAEKFVAGIQGGILYVISDYKEKISNDKIETDNSWGFNIEPNLSFLATENILLQFGVRYQMYSVKFTDPEMSVTKNDRFFGATLAAIYLW